MPKRQRPPVDSAELKSATKRSRRDPPRQHERDFYSLPQSESEPTCKYYLRSLERKKPVNFYQSVLTNSNNSNTSLAMAASADALRRNAHSNSYTVKRLSGRCSTTSTASSRRRKLESLRNDCNVMVMTRKRRKQQQEEQEKVLSKQDVSLAISVM